MMRSRLRTWVTRLALLGIGSVALLLFGVIPIGGSFLITNTRFRPDGDVNAGAPFPVEDVRFAASDGIRLRGWWSPREEGTRGTVVFVHGLNRSRLEMLDRAAAIDDLGFSTLLFDLRNHGESEKAHTTLGIRESGDVCRAAEFARSRHPEAPVVLWGVSLGASAALLGARCARADAVISDSSFLSLEDTVRHHFSGISGLPAFPIADLLLLVTRLRMGFTLADGDVEAAVEAMPDVPIFFVAGGQDWRMPPEIAERLLAASDNRGSRLFLVGEATHGHAFGEDPEGYLGGVAGFLAEVLAPAVPAPTLY